MGFAIELYFDPVSEARLTGLWETLARAGISSILPDMGARPHISLAVMGNLDPAAFRAELRAFADEEDSLAVTLGAVGTFPTAEGVVYIAPVVTQALLDLHARFHRRLDDLGVASGAYYRPGHWIPHCTTALELPPDQVAAAVDVCRQGDVFGPTRLVSVGLIEFLPVRELYTFPLGDAP